MSLIKSILSSEDCARCRVCCGFTRDDIWEIPLIFSENREKVEEKLGVRLEARGSEYVFDMRFDGELSFCPALTESGCALGALKPFDCAVWPFRVNSLYSLDDLDSLDRLGGMNVITVSPVCESVSSLPLKTLTEFVKADGFAEKLFETARLHPDIVKPYIDGYPIVAVNK